MQEVGYTPDSDDFARMAEACARSKDVARAEAFMTKAISLSVKPNLSLVNAVLKVCARAGDTAGVDRWMARMREAYDLVPDLVSFNTAIAAFAEAGDPSAARRLLERCRNVSLRPDAMSYTPLIRACAPPRGEESSLGRGREKAGGDDTGPAEQARLLLQRMSDERVMPDTTAYNAALHVSALSGSLGHMWRIYDMMQAEGVVADAATYRTLALLYARCGDIERAEDILHRARLDGHGRGARELDLLLSACGNAWPRDNQKAERTFRDMLAAGIKPSSQSLRFLQMAMGKDRAIELAEELNVPWTAPDGRRPGTRTWAAA
mmetsp:Transcript_82838/g.268374  ORF Transcript_82838/g.268374 Transcript_82838/m.268374 type:complete len:320 (-) Transcript_82838:47-1006(-)